MLQNLTSGNPSIHERLIVVVDDEPSILYLVVRLLSAAGYKAVAFSTPRAVLDSLDEMPVSLVVSDVSMPEMSGFALTHLVHQRQPGLPVVLMTGGHFDPEIDPIATDFGAFALLHKPFDANLLWSTVEHALAQGQQTVQEHARQTPLTAARLRGSLP